MTKTIAFFVLTFFAINSYATLSFTKEEYDYIKTNKVKVAMLPDFPPFSIYENANLKGFSYDILELVSKKSGLNFEYEIAKWPVNLKKFKEKKVDIIDSISFREERLDFTLYTKPYYEIPLVIFARKDIDNYSGLKSLKGKRLGLTKNIFYKEQVKDLNIFEIVEYSSFEEKLQALAFGEIDLIFGHLLSTQMAIKKSQYINIRVLDELNLANLKKTDLRFGITKENKILYEIFNRTYNSITKVEWEELYNKWISIYTKQEKTTTLSSLTSKERAFLIKNKIKCAVSSWPPFIINDKGTARGISVDFWKLIKQKALIESQCKVLDSFSEVLEKIKNKELDLTIATAITEDKLSYGRFSSSYISYPLAIVTTFDKRFIPKTSFLNGKKVAVTKASSGMSILKDKYPNIQIEEYNSNLEALKALSKGNVYAVIDILPVLSHLIGEHGFKNLKISGTTEFNLDIRIMVRDDYKELIPIINKAIVSISKEEKQAIKNKWLSVKYEQVVEYKKFWQVSIIILVILLILFYRQYILNKHNKSLKEANNQIELKTIQLSKQKMLFEKIFEESSDGIFLVSIDNKGKIVKCNDKAYSLLGYSSKEEFLILKNEDILPMNQPDGKDSFLLIKELFKNTIEKGSAYSEIVHKKKDGSNIWIEVVLTSIVYDDEHLIHVVWRDIQQRKDIEEKLSLLTHNLEEKVLEEVKKNEQQTRQLIQQSRLAQMGEMLSMIAHQWRQPLTAISATTNNILIRLMIDEKIEKKELEHEISLILDYSQHLSMTIDDFRNFFKRDKEKIKITLEEVINNSMQIVRSSFESNEIRLKTNFNCNKELFIYANELNQVILNLLKNSEDALVDNLVLDSYIELSTYLEDKYAVLEVKDNGGGVNEKIIDKIFDPYFSTKTSKEGTGLGLYMSKLIISDHCKGSLSVRNDHKGAVFIIKIPL